MRSNSRLAIAVMVLSASACSGGGGGGKDLGGPYPAVQFAEDSLQLAVGTSAQVPVLVQISADEPIESPSDLLPDFRHACGSGDPSIADALNDADGCVVYAAGEGSGPLGVSLVDSAGEILLAQDEITITVTP